LVSNVARIGRVQIIQQRIMCWPLFAFAVQLYRADYVKLHFVHYSTITELTMMNKEETDAAGYVWRMRVQADPKGRFTDELNEGALR
jgi:hypothetical protein